MTRFRHSDDLVAPTSELYRLANERMGGNLPAWLAEHRRKHRPTSYRRLVIELAMRTGVQVSFETLRTWDDLLNEADEVPA